MADSGAPGHAGLPLVEYCGIAEAALAQVLGADELVHAAIHGTTLLLASKGGQVLRLDASSSGLYGLASFPSSIRSAAIDDAGRRYIVGLANGSAVSALLRPESAGSDSSWKVEHGSSAVTAVALCPDFCSLPEESQLCCTGGVDGRLLLHKRLRGSGRTLVQSGDGAIEEVAWRGSFVAWASAAGVKILSIATGQKIAFLPWPEDELPRSTRCRLVWCSDMRLLLSSGHRVKAVSVQPMGVDNVLFYAQVHRHIRFDGQVCGMAPLSEDSDANIVALIADASAGFSLQLCGQGSDESHEACVFHREVLPLPRALSRDAVHLLRAAAHLPMYVAAPIELIAFQVMDIIEHCIALIEKKCFDEAIDLVNFGGQGSPTLPSLVCIKSVLPELRAQNFEKACARTCRIRGLDAATWQECVRLFREFGALEHLAVHIPVPPQSASLPAEVYDTVLDYLLDDAPEALRTVLHWWPTHIFNSESLEEKLESRRQQVVCSRRPSISSKDSVSKPERCRIEALALLRAANGAPLDAASLLVNIGSPDVFRLLHTELQQSNAPDPQQGAEEALENRQRLSRFVLQHLESLFRIDPLETASLAVAHRSCPGLGVDEMMKALGRSPSFWQHEYLKQLFAQDQIAGQDYHMTMVKLYADHEPRGLLGFLKASERYPLSEALGICRERGLPAEEAYLLGRDEKTEEALQILLEDMNDVKLAVGFVAEHQGFTLPDPRRPGKHDKLLETLLQYVTARPDTLITLLECLEEMGSSREIGGKPIVEHFQLPAEVPLRVLRQMPKDVKVRRLSTPVARIFSDYQLRRGIHSSCKQIIKNETLDREKCFLARRKRGVAVNPTKLRCSFCGRLLSDPAAPIAAAGSATTSVGDAARSIFLQSSSTLHGECRLHRAAAAAAAASASGTGGGAAATSS